MSAVTKLHPTSVNYRDHIIKLTHRPQLNDWQYHVEHTRTITLSRTKPRYQAALNAAKQDIDILLGGRP